MDTEKNLLPESNNKSLHTQSLLERLRSKKVLSILLIICVMFGVISIGIYFFMSNQKQKAVPNTPRATPSPTIPMITEYSNPFSQENQYANPFDTYQNPFEVLE